MADDRATWRKNIPEDFDGKMADTWDGEISVKAVVNTSIGIVITCAITFILCWGMVAWFAGQAEAAKTPPSVLAEANEPYSPPGPRLQSHPEHEMSVLRHETEMRLNNYGWVDEAAGTVHIPVEAAMHMLVEQAAQSQGDAASADGDADGEAATDATDSADAEPAEEVAN